MSTALNIDQIALQPEAELTRRVNLSLSGCKMLGRVYDPASIQSLVGKHGDPNNYLLWVLASHSLSASHIIEALDGSLAALESFGAIASFTSKLRQYETAKVRSIFPELQLPREFAERGFSIEFEPSIVGTAKNPDFKASNDDVSVFVEITNLVEEEIDRRDKVKATLWRNLRRVPEKLVFRLTVPEDLEMSEVPQIVSLVKRTLRSMGANVGPRNKYYLTRTKGEQVVLTVEALSPRAYGYLGGMLSSWTPGLQPSEFASKISKKTRQLPKDSLCMIVVSPSAPTMEPDEIEDALYGTPVPSFSTRTGGFVGLTRDERRVFHESRNTRVGAVCYYEWSAFDNGIVTTEIIYHNPFAAKPIDPSLLARKGVKQFVPKPVGNNLVEMKWL